MEALEDVDRQNTITDILCPAKEASPSSKRTNRRTAQPGEVAPIWPLRLKQEGLNKSHNKLRDSYNLIDLWYR